MILLKIHHFGFNSNSFFVRLINHRNGKKMLPIFFLFSGAIPIESEMDTMILVFLLLFECRQWMENTKAKKRNPNTTRNIKSINALIHFIEVWNKNITGIARMDE